MDSFQLRYALITKLDIFSAVCAEDQLHFLKPGKSFAIIVNNQPSTKDGMHWVCMYKSKNSKVVEFFDSFGLGVKYYPKTISTFCKKHGSFVKQNRIQFQSNLSDTCGNFCVWFLLTRNKFKAFSTAINKLSTSDTVGNDKRVLSFTRKMFTFPSFSDCKDMCKKICEMKNQPFSEICYQVGKQCFRIESGLHAK